MLCGLVTNNLLFLWNKQNHARGFGPPLRRPPHRPTPKKILDVPLLAWQNWFHEQQKLKIPQTAECQQNRSGDEFFLSCEGKIVNLVLDQFHNRLYDNSHDLRKLQALGILSHS